MPMTKDEEIDVKRGCAERAMAYVDNSYWVDIEYGRDRWDIDLDDLRAAIMDGESEPETAAKEAQP